MGKKNRKSSNKIIYKKLKVNAGLENIFEERKIKYDNIRAGDVYILKDYEFSKERHDIPNTKTIKFERPVIVLYVSNSDLVSVIPITTSPSIKECRYPLKIEPGKCSYALISQFTTVDYGRLHIKIGVIKKDIFFNIINTFKMLMKYMSILPSNEAKEYRSVPMDNSKLDIIRYDPFHLYYNDIEDRAFLVVQLDNRDKIALDLIYGSKTCKSDTTIRTSFGLINLDTMNRINTNYYINREYEDIGVEFNLKVRTKIINKLKDVYNMNLLNTKDNDYLTDFTKTIYDIVDNGINYLEFYKKIYKYIRQPKYQSLILTDNKDKIKLFAKDIGVDINRLNKILPVLRQYVIESINIFKTNIASLNYIKANYPNLLKPIIIHYTSNTNENHCINESLVDNTIHFKKNIKWIASYIRNNKD